MAEARPAADREKCIVAAWHHPRFSSGSRERGFTQVRPFWSALDRAGADIVLSGHDHIYERFRKKASGAASRRRMRQFTVGTGGRSLGRFHTPEPGSQRFLSSSYGVLQLQLRSARYRWEFVSTKGSRVLDAGSATCR